MCSDGTCVFTRGIKNAAACVSVPAVPVHVDHEPLDQLSTHPYIGAAYARSYEPQQNSYTTYDLQAQYTTEPHPYYTLIEHPHRHSDNLASTCAQPNR